MLLAHFGVAVFIAGVTVVSGFQSETDVRMEPGETASVGGYSFRLDRRRAPSADPTTARPVRQADRQPAMAKTVAMVRRSGVSTTSAASPMTEVAIDRGVTRDLYVALGEPVSATAWSVRLHHKPLVNWIWGGCLLMALGGLLAVLDRRYRKVRVLRKQAAPAAIMAAAESARGCAQTIGCVRQG